MPLKLHKLSQASQKAHKLGIGHCLRHLRLMKMKMEDVLKNMEIVKSLAIQCFTLKRMMISQMILSLMVQQGNLNNTERSLIRGFKAVANSVALQVALLEGLLLRREVVPLLVISYS